MTVMWFGMRAAFYWLIIIIESTNDNVPEVRRILQLAFALYRRRRRLHGDACAGHDMWTHGLRPSTRQSSSMVPRVHSALLNFNSFSKIKIQTSRVKWITIKDWRHEKFIFNAFKKKIGHFPVIAQSNTAKRF